MRANAAPSDPNDRAPAPRQARSSARTADNSGERRARDGRGLRISAALDDISAPYQLDTGPCFRTVHVSRAVLGRTGRGSSLACFIRSRSHWRRTAIRRLGSSGKRFRSPSQHGPQPLLDRRPLESEHALADRVSPRAARSPPPYPPTPIRCMRMPQRPQRTLRRPPGAGAEARLARPRRLEPGLRRHPVRPAPSTAPAPLRARYDIDTQ